MTDNCGRWVSWPWASAALAGPSLPLQNHGWSGLGPGGSLVEQLRLLAEECGSVVADILNTEGLMWHICPHWRGISVHIDTVLALQRPGNRKNEEHALGFTLSTVLLVLDVECWAKAVLRGLLRKTVRVSHNCGVKLGWGLSCAMGIGSAGWKFCKWNHLRWAQRAESAGMVIRKWVPW